MNTRDLTTLQHWDETELAHLTARFVRVFHRLPSSAELVAFRRSQAGLHVRLPAQARRGLARMILTR